VKTKIAILWVASFAIGLVALFPKYMLVPVLWCLVAIETAHAMAPIGLAWTTAELRDMALGAPLKFIVAPAVAVVASFSLPFFWVFLAFVAANAWHFGMQNFGVLRLLGVRRWRWALMIGSIVVTATALVISMPALRPSFMTQQAAFLITLVVSVNHWITDLGLTRMASRRGVFLLGGLLLLGCVGYYWQRTTPNGVHRLSNDAMRIAYALGFVHFLYSRWVWQRGRELLVVG
jgi:hypothetical protein